MLSLAEEILLLGLDSKTGRPADLPPYSVQFAIAGAVLCDLALRDRIDSDLETLTVTDEAPTGDAILDAVLRAAIACPAPQTPRAWLLHLARVDWLLAQARTRLIEQRVLQPRKKALLGLGRNSYEILDPTEHQRVVQRLRDVLTREDIPDPRDIVTVCLAHACSLLGAILGDELEQAHRRIQQVCRLDLIGQGMLRELVETQALVSRVGDWGRHPVELGNGPGDDAR